MLTNQDRIRALFDRPELERFVNRLRQRRDAGQSLTGSLTLGAVSPDERRVIDQLLRRPTSAGASLRISLDTLLRQIRIAQIAGSWAEVLDVVCGPPDPRRALMAASNQSWEEIWNHFRELGSDRPMILKWLEQLRKDGLLKRLSCNETSKAQLWLVQALGLFRQLPLQDEPLASVAARLTNNSHGLDQDAPLATIIMRGLALLYNCAMPKSTAARRDLWAKAGIACDELSAPVLVFNLSLEHASPLSDLLKTACTAGVPLHLSTRLLLSTDWRSAVGPNRIFICENASVIALVVRRLGAASSPLVCLDGEPKTAGWFLLDHLRDAGSELWYHGDFDWKGVAIASRVMKRVGAKPWRYSAKDYLEASGVELLRGSTVPTPWCPELANVLHERGIAIHEEAIAETLLKDLQSP